MFGCWCFFFPGKAMCSQNSRSVALVTFNCPIGQFQEEDQVSITFDKFHNKEMPKKKKTSIASYWHECEEQMF